MFYNLQVFGQEFSLRSQTFCYTADFSTTFLYLLKTKTFCISHHKTTSKHPRIQEFWLYFAKKIVILEKNGKAPSSSCLLLYLGMPMACSNTYVKHFEKFPDFFKTQCWQLWRVVSTSSHNSYDMLSCLLRLLKFATILAKILLTRVIPCMTALI